MPRPGSAGSEPTPQALATSAARLGVGDRRPPGSRMGSAPASIAPRSPARRGIQASWAPVSLGQPGRGGQRARHLGQPLADQDHRARLAQGAATAGERCLGGQASAAGPSASAVSAAASAPGTVGSSVPDSLSRPGLASAASE